MEKISKSIGNGISVEDWLKFSPQESLELFMFQTLAEQRDCIYVIPKMTDDYLKLRKIMKCKIVKKNIKSVWFINKTDNYKFLENFSFNMILNLANVCNAESPEILGFIENYYKDIKRIDFPLIHELLNYGVQYYNEFVLPNKKYRKPNEIEITGFRKIIEELKIDENCQPEDIQTKIYQIGMDLKFETLGTGFQLYQVVLGQDQGPRLGSL